MIRKIFRFTGGTGTAIGVHAAYVEYAKHRHHLERKVPLDQLVVDNLETGDIILFARSWWHHHLPMAICLRLYHDIHGTIYDHVGIIVKDRHDIPHLLEICPYKGYTLRNVEDRFAYSRAHQICVIPLLPRTSCSADQREKIFMSMKTTFPVSSGKSELGGLAKGLLTSILTKLNINWMSDTPSCVNGELVAESMRLLGINLAKQKKEDNDHHIISSATDGITISDILNRTIFDQNYHYILDKNTTMIKME